MLSAHVTIFDKAEAKGSVRVDGLVLNNALLDVSAGACSLALVSSDGKTFRVAWLAIDGKDVKLAPGGG